MQTFHNALNWEKGGLKKRNSRVIHPKTKHGGGGWRRPARQNLSNDHKGELSVSRQKWTFKN